MNVDESSPEEFLDRFSSFNDAVIRRIEFSYAASGHRRATLTISAHDRQARAGWSNVVIAIDQVSEVGFREGKATRQVLSDGLTLAWSEGSLWCDLSRWSSEVEDIEDLRRSDFYLVGKTISWRVEPYAEG